MHCCVLARCFAWWQSLLAQDDLEKRATWSIPTTADVKARLDDYLADQNARRSCQTEDRSPLARRRPAAGWRRIARSADRVAGASSSPKRPKSSTPAGNNSASDVAPKFDGLTDESLPPLVRDNLRLLVGRWLAQHDLVDESLEVLKDVGTDNVADPATLLFYQAVGQHRLLKKDECLAAASKLLERESELPRRYVTLARLMEADIKPLKEDSLDEIARMMDDIRRRLALARAGKVVRDEEDSVIAKLEKMIDELEKQRQMRAAATAASPNRGGRAAEQSACKTASEPS